MMDYIAENQQLFGGIAAFVAMIGVLIRYVFRPTAQYIAASVRLVQVARDQLLPNGGSSLADKVDCMSEQLYQTRSDIGVVRTSLDKHIEDADEGRTNLGDRITTLNDTMTDHLVSGGIDDEEVSALQQGANRPTD